MNQNKIFHIKKINATKLLTQNDMKTTKSIFNMKHVSFCFVLFFTLSSSLFTLCEAQLVGINKTGATPSSATVLDLNTGNAGVNKGFLPPQVALTAANDNSTIPSADIGLVIYNTATAGAAPNNVVPGYYYWTGSAWALMLAPSEGSSGQVLTSNGGGAPSWTTPASSGLTGSGMPNYVARWAPSGSKLSTGIMLDDSNAVGINAFPYPTAAMLNIIGNGTNSKYNTITTDALYNGSGILATTSDPYGYGVYATSQASGIGTAILAYGVSYGINAQAIDTGVAGSGGNIGVYGTTSNAGGVGVQGVNGAAGGTGIAGYGTGLGSIGVYGFSDNAGGNAVYGFNTNGIGVVGSSAATIGVFGTTSNAGGYGVEGNNATGTAIYGYSHAANYNGVEGVNANWNGVYGSGITGVAGVGTTNGMYGTTANASGYGLEGVNTGTGGVGVYGNASGTGSAGLYGVGTTYGVSGITGGAGVAGAYGGTSNSSGYGVEGLNSATNGTGIYGSGAGSGYGVYGYNNTGTGVNGFGGGSSGTGVNGSGNLYGIYGTGNTGVYGVSNANGPGVEGDNSIASSWGVYGSNTAGTGIKGYSNTNGYSGVEGDNANWVGVYGNGLYGVSGNGATGVYGVGVDNGVQGNTVTGIGVSGIASGSGEGIWGESSTGVPVYGYYDGAASTGEVFQGHNILTGQYTEIDYYNGHTEYKILGAGSVSTTVNDTLGNRVVLHAPETPEIYFEDYGEGQLVKGSVHITLDPTIAKNVIINEKHPLRVFIQLKGDCKGTYVTNQSATGFDVVELSGGTSDAPFSWHIVCNRADEIMQSGKVSQFADLRFEKAPDNVNIKAKATPFQPAMQTKTK